MTDKERLEEIKNSCLEGLHRLFGAPWVSMPKENFDWLINRVEELEEALEFYADKENWKKLIIDNNTMYLGKMNIEQDYGETARKVLGG